MGSSGSTQGPHTTAFLCHLDPLQSQDIATFTARLSTRPLHVWKDTFPPTNKLVSTCLHFYSCKGHRSHPGVMGRTEQKAQDSRKAAHRSDTAAPIPHPHLKCSERDSKQHAQKALCISLLGSLACQVHSPPGALTASCSGEMFPLSTTCCSAALLRGTRAPVSSLHD